MLLYLIGGILTYLFTLLFLFRYGKVPPQPRKDWLGLLFLAVLCLALWPLVLWALAANAQTLPW